MTEEQQYIAVSRRTNDNSLNGEVNADVSFSLVVSFNLNSNSGLGEPATVQVPSKAEVVPDARQAAVEGAARELVVARLTGRRLDRLPSAFRPNNFEAALQTQLVVGALLEERVAGWKC